MAGSAQDAWGFGGPGVTSTRHMLAKRSRVASESAHWHREVEGESSPAVTGNVESIVVAETGDRRTCGTKGRVSDLSRGSRGVVGRVRSLAQICSGAKSVYEYGSGLGAERGESERRGGVDPIGYESNCVLFERGSWREGEREGEIDGVPAFSHAWIRAVPWGTVTETPSTSRVTSAWRRALNERARVDEALARCGSRRAAEARGVRQSMLDIEGGLGESRGREISDSQRFRTN